MARSIIFNFHFSESKIIKIFGHPLLNLFRQVTSIVICCQTIIVSKGHFDSKERSLSCQKAHRTEMSKGSERWVRTQTPLYHNLNQAEWVFIFEKYCWLILAGVPRNKMNATSARSTLRSSVPYQRDIHFRVTYKKICTEARLYAELTPLNL